MIYDNVLLVVVLFYTAGTNGFWDYVSLYQQELQGCGGEEKWVWCNENCPSGWTLVDTWYCMKLCKQPECEKKKCILPQMTGDRWWSIWLDLPHGDGALFTAEPGFTCVNEGYRVCNDGHLDRTPSCKGKPCSLPWIDGGRWNNEQRLNRNLKTEAGTTATFRALPGYTCVNEGLRRCSERYGTLDAIPSCTYDDGYMRYSPGCVNGNNIAKRSNQSVEECKAWCNEVSSCKGFEYWRGDRNQYKAKDCQLSSSSDMSGCDGTFWKNDFYLKGDNEYDYDFYSYGFGDGYGDGCG